MTKIFYPANERGHSDLGWLQSDFSFSFGPWYNPEKVHFGMLRVLNDDTVAGGMGFGMHPHDNMEIITVMLSGTLEHKDSMGNVGQIKAGEVQVMSAGTGIMHSEYNPSKTEEAKLFQTWIFPSKRDIKPRYDQKSFTDAMKLNELTTVVSGDKDADTLFINQDAAISFGDFEAGKTVQYDIKVPGNGAYVLQVEGGSEVDGSVLNKRDAIGVYDTSSFTIETKSQSRLLIIEVPMR
ncbi:pirin family protein [Mucilaginibacter ginsenosidivorans]|uniref:Pirin family protein n=1 Tax=Mucilaginibacter ginsenosidivorans TaxID=398053 RepID=A0A5B8URL3_9SPHI|nr:pirin family protein [Mucilaginibacter ginsenosidivorans]QEC61684.1 pirin family protein [Mucilaginibacter ginsenosidivorans]